MKRLTKWYSGLNIYYKLTPFLLLYLIICIVFAPHENVGDEGRYLYFANNLLSGFYSPPYPEINLWNGPGYPLFLAPFIFFELPLIALRLLNVFIPQKGVLSHIQYFLGCIFQYLKCFH